MQLPKHPYGKLTNDFVFKRIFGTESTKDILIMFLNHMIGSPRIVDVTIRNSEQLGMTSEDRKAVFDITCLTDRNEHFIVEMQHASQEFFRERATFYTSYLPALCSFQEKSMTVCLNWQNFLTSRLKN